MQKGIFRVGLLLSAAAWPIALQAQTAGAPAAQASSDDTPSSEIVVTGSRGQQRTVTDSPVAIDVIGNADIEKNGHPGWHVDEQPAALAAE